MRKIRRIRKLFLNLVLLSITLLILFIFFETSLRLFYPQNMNWVRYDTELGAGYVLRENFHAQVYQEEFTFEMNTNSKGLREEIDYPYNKPKIITRILVLGDSYTYGHSVNVNESYPKQLLRKLVSNGFTNVEVINAGVPSYSTYKEMMYLKNEGYKYNPDIVIVGLCVGNDFGDDVYAKENIEAVTKILKTKKPLNKYLSLRIREFLSSHLHTFAYIRNILRHTAQLNKIFTKLGILSKVNEFSLYHLENDNIFEVKNSTEDLRKTVEILDEIYLFTSKNNMTLIFLIIPTSEQIDPNYFSERSYKKEIDPERPNKFVLKFAEEKNIHYVIDILPSFKNHEDSLNLYWKIDSHPNSKGYGVIADVIYNVLINNQLISSQRKD